MFQRVCFQFLLCLGQQFFTLVLNAPGPVLLGADVHENPELVVDHVDGTFNSADILR